MHGHRNEAVESLHHWSFFTSPQMQSKQFTQERKLRLKARQLSQTLFQQLQYLSRRQAPISAERRLQYGDRQIEQSL